MTRLVLVIAFAIPFAASADPVPGAGPDPARPGEISHLPIPGAVTGAQPSTDRKGLSPPNGLEGLSPPGE